MNIQHRGFTLFEIMIALAIFSVAALAVLKFTNNALTQQYKLEEKIFALWVAENEIAELRLRTSWPNTGIQENSVTNADAEWRVSTKVSDTPLASFRKITVSVFRQSSGKPSITLTGYIGEH